MTMRGGLRYNKALKLMRPYVFCICISTESCWML
jgi:hypothetical protein